MKGVICARNQLLNNWTKEQSQFLMELINTGPRRRKHQSGPSIISAEMGPAATTQP
jgi:hypothetical protein